MQTTALCARAGRKAQRLINKTIVVNARLPLDGEAVVAGALFVSDLEKMMHCGLR
jgi:hypothetical protein